MDKLSVVLAVRNEEENIERCLDSIKDIADEIIVVDEYSTDKTREIAKKFGAKVFLEKHHDIFHITKQKALDKATGDWVLQLDADEVVTPELSKDIVSVLKGESVGNIPLRKRNLFFRHQRALEKRDGVVGKKDGEIVAYFVPRRNMFLGEPLIHAGVYPDGVIRLIKNKMAEFPQKSVHEQIKVDGRVSWLPSDLLHYDSPTLERYFSRMNRYTDLQAKELKRKKVKDNIINFARYIFVLPSITFMKLYFRHLGFMDKARGFLWSFLSSLHYPIAYLKLITQGNNEQN